MLLYFLSLTILTVVSCQQYTTPVPILKQINKHNEDGSYSYGYEAADGTYKIETKYPNGEVYGKYGYIDDQGKLRTVEYGASRRGFEPAGNEIQVPPPTLKNAEPAAARPLAPNEEDDGQYREDPSVYYKNEARNQRPQSIYNRPSFQSFQDEQSAYQPQSVYQSQPAYQPQPQPQSQPAYQPQPQPTYQQQPAFRPQTNFNFPSTQPRLFNNPVPTTAPYRNYNSFQGHPASNVDIYTGSYSVNYRR